MKRYRDPKSTVIQDWKWQPLRKVQEKFDLTEIPSHVEKFGEFMDETARRAAEQGLTPRDLVKAYTLTRFSIQRTARKALILRKAGLILPSGIDDQDKIRPEGAFGHWLHTKHGQKYLDEAEAGRVDEEAIADAQEKLRTFGKVDKDLPDALRWAPKNLPGQEARVSELVRRSMRGQSDPSEWRNEMRGLKGIRSAKAGFIAAQLGRGDQPTLDARQLVEHTGRPSKEASKYTARKGGLGATEAVQRLAARQTAMDLKLPKEMQPNYQHLAHHAFWDAAEGEKTTHDDVMSAMRTAKNGGRIARADGGRNRLPTAEDIIRAMKFAGFPAMEEAHRLARDNPAAFKNLVEGVTSRYSDNPETRKRAEEIADSYKIPLTGRLARDSAYYNINQPVTPQRVKSTVEPLPGAPLKPKRFMSWEDLHREGAGGTLINLGGDRSRSGVLTHIMDRKLAWPVKLFAGPEFMREYNRRQVWASAPGPSSALLNLTQEASKKGKPVYGAYSPMGVQSSDSAHHMFDALMAQVPGSGLDPKAAAKFDRALKNGEHILGVSDDAKRERSRVRDVMKKWPGLANAREASEFAKGLTGKHRSAIVKFMDKAPWLEAGLPPVGMTRIAISDPEVWSTPGNMIGHRVVRLDPDYVPEEGSGKYPHTTYKAPTGGEYVGDVPPVERQHAMPDPMIERAQKPAAGNRLVHPFSSDPMGRSTTRKLFEENKQTQPMTDEWMENIRRGQQGRAGLGLKSGGRVGKADGGEIDDPAAPPPSTPGIGHNQPPEATPPPASYIKPVDEDKRRLTPLGFYSHAAEAVWKQPMMKASPAQFKATLLNKHGVKPDEFKWSGYDEVFADRPMVSKKEVRDHFIKNLPNIQESMKADHENEYGDKYSRHPDDDSWEETKYSDHQLPGAKNYRELVLHMPKEPHPDLPKLRRAKLDAIAKRGAAAQEKVRAAAAANAITYRTDPAYTEAQKRMVVAHIAHETARDDLNEIHRRIEELETKGNYKSSHWSEKNPLLHLRVSDRAGPEVEKYQWVNRTSGNGTRHFDSEDEANQHLALLPERLRPDLYLRKLKRPMKILHVEEIQSDWGQDARDKGFVEDREARKQQVFEAERRLNVAHQLGKPDAEKAAAQAALDKLLDAQAEEKGPGVPSAPYIDKTGKWTELGLKRVLHEAATGGYDRIVFTPGEEQAKRYSLEDHVESIHVADNPEAKGKYLLSVKPKGSRNYSDDVHEVPHDKLADHIGKELADKIIAEHKQHETRRAGLANTLDYGLAPHEAKEMGVEHVDPASRRPFAKEYGGLDLKVGGEGMRGYYDKIVPKALEKLAKQYDPDARVQVHGHEPPPETTPWSVRVKSTGKEYMAKFKTRESAYQWVDKHHGDRARDHEAFQSVPDLHALDITPKMRASIRLGQRAYAGGGRVARAMAGSVDMGSTPYTTNVITGPAPPGQPTGQSSGSSGSPIMGMAASGGLGGSGGAGGSPGDEKEFMRMIAGPSGEDDITRTIAAGMLASGNYTFSGQRATKPEPVPVDPNAKPDYPVIRAAGGRAQRADGGAVDDPSAQPTDDYQRQVSPIGLYSHAAEAVWKQPQMKASPQQFKATLINKHNVKPDEFKWTGYDQAFDGRDYVTKREVRDHFQQNMPEVQETIKREAPYHVTDRQGVIRARGLGWEEAQAHADRIGGNYDVSDDAVSAPKYGQWTLPGGQNYREVLLHLPSEPSEEAIRARFLEMMNATGFGPGVNATQGERNRVYEEARRSAQHDVNTRQFKGPHFDGFPNLLAHLRFSDRTGPNGEKVLHVEEVQSDWGQQGRDDGFQTPIDPAELKVHQDAKATAQQKMHAARDAAVAKYHAWEDAEFERTAKNAKLWEMSPEDVAGVHAETMKNRALSPVIQGAKLRDFIKTSLPQTRTHFDDVWKAWQDATEEHRMAELRLGAFHDKHKSGVPDAPHIGTTDKWTDLALKRVLHEAATGDYDKVVFTNGKDQADRYDLSQHIKKIEARKTFSKNAPKPYSIDAYRHDGAPVISEYYSAEQLPSVVGAEMAAKIIDDLEADFPEKETTGLKTYSSLDLKVGGEGMKQYYDKQMPKRLEKLARMHDPKADVKLYGHKMPKPIEGGVSGEDIMNDLGVDHDAQDTYWRALSGPMREQHMQEYRRRRANDSYALHALEVTPAMRASILKGQRGFAAGGRISERINERVYQKVRKVVPVAGRYEEGGKA